MYSEKTINQLYSTLPFLNKRFSFFKDLPKKANILDYGCGDGYIINNLINYRQDIICTGVDLDDFEKKTKDIKNFKFLQIEKDAKLPFADNSFDAVIMNHVLEHIPDPLNLLKELLRVLNSGGKIYIETPNTRSLFLPSLLDDAAPLNFYDDYTHIRPFTKKSLNKILKHSGFQIKKIGIFRNYFYLIISPLLLPFVFIKSKRNLFLLGLTSLVGWAIYGIGEKKSPLPKS